MSVIQTANPAFVMRRATAADRDAVVALADAAMPGDWIPDSYDQFMADTGPGGLFVGQLDGHVVGCYHVELPHPDEAYFSAMRVHPAVQGRGLGSLFCGAQVEHARQLGARNVYLLSLVGNTPAHRTVAKNGFVNQGEWVIYYDMAQINPQGAAQGARPARAEDKTGIERLLAQVPQDDLSGIICEPDSPWVLMRRQGEPYAVDGVLVVDGSTGIEGIMVLQVALGTTNVRLLEGSAGAAADLLALADVQGRHAGSKHWFVSLPARSEHLLASLGLDRDKAFRAYLFHCQV